MGRQELGEKRSGIVDDAVGQTVRDRQRDGHAHRRREMRRFHGLPAASVRAGRVVRLDGFFRPVENRAGDGEDQRQRGGALLEQDDEGPGGRAGEPSSVRENREQALSDSVRHGY